MPFIHVRYSTPAERDLRQPIADVLTETTARVLRKKAEVTALAVEQVAPASWFIGATSVAELRKATGTPLDVQFLTLRPGSVRKLV